MPDWIATVALVATRVAAMILIVPGVSQSVVPWRIRFLLVATLCVPVLCVLPPTQINTSELPSLLLHEAIVGISLGLVPAAIVFGLQTSVRTLQGMTGLADSPTAADPCSLSSTGVLDRLFLIVALTVFFSSGGHRVVFQAVLESFQWMAPGSFRSAESANELLVDMFSASFRLGVRAVTPIGLSLGISLMAIAAINRLLPQISFFAVGMSVQAMVLFGALVLFAGTVVWFLDDGLGSNVDSTRLRWQMISQQAGP